MTPRAHPHDTRTTVPADLAQDEAAAATRALVAHDERPTAIVYDSDVTALAAVTVPAEPAQTLGVVA